MNTWGQSPGSSTELLQLRTRPTGLGAGQPDTEAMLPAGGRGPLCAQHFCFSVPPTSAPLVVKQSVSRTEGREMGQNLLLWPKAPGLMVYRSGSAASFKPLQSTKQTEATLFIGKAGRSRMWIAGRPPYGSKCKNPKAAAGRWNVAVY